MIKELKYVAGNRPMDGSEGGDTPCSAAILRSLIFEPLYPDSDCALMSTTWRNSLQSLAWFMRYWRDNFSTAYDLNRIFMIGSDNLCMANFGLRDIPLGGTRR